VPARERGGGSVRGAQGLDGRFVVGFCGSLKRWHGVHRLLEAAASALPAVPNLALLIVGDGPERAALERHASELDLADRVRFTGAVPHPDVPAHLAACDVLAAPYQPMADFYFSPLKVAEYVAAGRPVIASAAGDIPNLLEGIEGITLFEPGDTDALQLAIVRCSHHAPQGAL